jgi:hypothetical protein
MILKRDDAFTVVCELKTPKEDGSYVVGTGIFVTSPARNGNVFSWIVTANHVAKETTEQTIVVVSTKDGIAQQLPLNLFGPLSSWKHHPFADISAFSIQVTTSNIQFLNGRKFLPMDHFNLKQESVSRDFELTCIGFPRGLGTEGLFSPFTFRSFASSGFFRYPRFDTKQECIFFCLENPSVGGYSGGPILDLGYSTNGVFEMKKEKTLCHGIMHGTMCDDTGGKIAMVTSAFYLKDIIGVV